jgi:hypothetical protein
MTNSLHPAIADQPWPYRRLDATLVSWGFEAVLPHDLSGSDILQWQRPKKSGVGRDVFSIAPPTWATHDSDEPVWPQKLTLNQMIAQKVFIEGHSFVDLADSLLVPAVRGYPNGRSSDC